MSVGKVCPGFSSNNTSDSHDIGEKCPQTIAVFVFVFVFLAILFRPFGFIPQTLLIYLTFQSFDSEHT